MVILKVDVSMTKQTLTDLADKRGNPQAIISDNAMTIAK